MIEAAIDGAGGIAQHAGLTRLLLERGADPNDEETPYHVTETTDNSVLKILLESGKLNEKSLGCWTASDLRSTMAPIPQCRLGGARIHFNMLSNGTTGSRRLRRSSITVPI